MIIGIRPLVGAISREELGLEFGCDVGVFGGSNGELSCGGR